MSLTMHRVIQYIVIITFCALAGGGYWYWKDRQAKAAVMEKSFDTTGLVGYWSFDEGSGTTSEDFSPTGSNTGTLTNSPAWVDGKVGKALSFDGADDWVNAGSSTSLNVSTDYTISMWVYNGAGSDTYPTLLNRATQATGNGFFWVYTGGTNEADLSFQWADGTNFQSTAFNGALGLNTWQHVVFTFDNASKALKLYINGSQFSTTRTLTNSLPIDDGTLYIGTYNGTATNYSFQGSLDEFRIYTRALSGTEVTALYQKSVGSKVNTTENSEVTNGLVGLWSFNGADVSGTTAYDRSGSGNNGTLTNGPAVTSGKIGQALSFDGVNDYVTIPDAAVLRKGSGSLSLSLWANPKNQNQSMTFLTKRQGGGSYEQYSVGVCGTNTHNWPSGKRICFLFAESINSIERSGYTNIDVADGDWHHIVVVADSVSDAIRVYVDGVNVPVTMDFSSGAWPVIDNTDPLEIGRNLYYDSSLDEVRVYNRALSVTEAWNLYQAGGGARVNSANSQSDSLERGLSGYWKLDDASGTTATDASTNGNNGTLTNGPTWTTGQIGGAVSFDGSDDYVNTTSTIDTSLYTVCSWVYPQSNGLYQRIITTPSGNTHKWVLTFSDVVSNSQFVFSRNSGSEMGKGTGATSLNTWHHVCGVWDGTTLSVYLDGVSRNNSVEAGWVYGAGSGLRIGRRHDNQYPLNGRLDEIRVYSRALSPEEVAKLYKSTAPDNPDSSLKGYWSFNGPDVSGTTAFDRSGVGNNGTLTSGPVVTPGKVGQALSFDGVDDYVSMGDVNAIDSASTLTLSVWLKRRAVNSILTVGKSEAQSRTFNINAYNDGKIYVNVGDGGTNAYGSFISNDTDWHHVVFVFDGNLSGNANRAKAYLDGVAQSLTFNNTIPAATQASADVFTVGRDVILSTYSAGNIDEVRVYSRAFTQTEVTNLYNLGH